MTKKIPILGFILLGGLGAGGWVGGCITDPTDSSKNKTDETGEVSFNLQVGAGLTLNTVSYTITGPVGFTRMGTIDVSQSSTVSAVISDIPFGTGYQISLRGTTTDGRGDLHGLGDVRRQRARHEERAGAPDLRRAAERRQHLGQRPDQRLPAHRRRRPRARAKSRSAARSRSRARSSISITARRR